MSMSTLLYIIIGFMVSNGMFTYFYRNTSMSNTIFITLLVLLNGGCIYPVAVLIGIPPTHPVLFIMIISGGLLGLQGGRVITSITKHERDSQENKDNE